MIFLGYSDDPALQRSCAGTYIRDRIKVMPPPLWQGERYSHDKIRLAYLSADLHQHATAYLTAELFERHDRERFEIHCSSPFGEDDGSSDAGAIGQGVRSFPSMFSRHRRLRKRLR